jgi:hypothetical protein
MNSVIGQTLNHIKVHEPMSLIGTGQKPQQCFGALTLWFDHAAVVLRSPRRYNKPGLGDLLNCEQPCSSEPAITLCSHEEAEWLMQAIGIGWQKLPECGRLVLDAHATDHAMRIEFAPGNALWTHYREDLDGCWMVGADELGPTVTAIELTTPDAVFGWLLPKAPYSVLWNGQLWQDLATAWACVANRAPPDGRERLFRQLYCLRLAQHPNLLRRFAALRYPVRCHQQPWLAQQVEMIRSTASRQPRTRHRN